MKPDLLLEVPQTHRPKLEVWKERHGVFIERIRYRHPQDTDTWRAFKDYYADHIGHGETEELACHNLAELLALPFLESISTEDARIK